jgi:hypothetical protein
MSKRSIQTQETLYCGIDVSAKSLAVAIQRRGSESNKSGSLTIRRDTELLSSGYGKLSSQLGCRWKQRKLAAVEGIGEGFVVYTKPPNGSCSTSNMESC